MRAYDDTKARNLRHFQIRSSVGQVFRTGPWHLPKSHQGCNWLTGVPGIFPPCQLGVFILRPSQGTLEATLYRECSSDNGTMYNERPMARTGMSCLEDERQTEMTEGLLSELSLDVQYDRSNVWIEVQALHISKPFRQEFE